MEDNKMVKMAPPWIQYVNGLKAMFAKDPEVRVEFNDGENYVKLFVDNQRKADALSKLLPLEMTFGNVTLGIIVLASNKATSAETLFRDAFEGNEAVTMIHTVAGAFTNPLTYVVFAKEVVQFYNDDLSDLHGNRSTLYQELAKELFLMKDGVFFCTDNGRE